jgi:CRP-like cAMP-binding protein
MARDDYLSYLSRVPLFADCSKSQLREIGRVVERIRFPAGAVLVRQGDLGFELFLMTEGTAKVEREGHLVASIGEGEFAGELAVLARTPRNATVTAETDLEVLSISPGDLSQLLDEVPGLAKQLLYEVATRLASVSSDA